jgi:CRP/FNR family transcriptional regulator, cyclic AMP receptor protein
MRASNEPDSGKLDLRIETLKQSWVFSDLSADKIAEIAVVAGLRRFARGEIIFNQGDPPNTLYVIGSGMVKQFKTCSSGRTFTTVINSSGDPLNVSALFSGKRHFVTTQAITDTTTVAIPQKDFMVYVENHPTIMLRILQVMGRIINSAYERLSDLAGATAAQRVLNVIFMLYFKFGATIAFTREEIADFAGTTPETTTRVLADLKSEGIIRSRRGGLEILDDQRLRSICHSSYLIPLNDMLCE